MVLQIIRLLKRAENNSRKQERFVFAQSARHRNNVSCFRQNSRALGCRTRPRDQEKQRVPTTGDLWENDEQLFTQLGFGTSKTGQKLLATRHD